MEDEACCAAASAASFRLRRGYLHPRSDGTARLRLKGPLSVGGLTAGAVSSQDVTIQVRTATDEVLCAQIPTANLVRRKTKLKFRDERAQLASVRGIDKVTIRTNKDGTGRLGMRGKSVALTVPEVETLTMTLGLRDPTSAESGNYCARGTAVFRSTSKGLRYP